MIIAFIFVLSVLLALIAALSWMLASTQQVVNKFPLILSERLALQQTQWMAALERKDKELRDVVAAYLAYQQKAIPIDTEKILSPRTPSAFRMKPNPPLTPEEKVRLGVK